MGGSGQKRFLCASMLADGGDGGVVMMSTMMTPKVDNSERREEWYCGVSAAWLSWKCLHVCDYSPLLSYFVVVVVAYVVVLLREYNKLVSNFWRPSAEVPRRAGTNLLICKTLLLVVLVVAAAAANDVVPVAQVVVDGAPRSSSALVIIVEDLSAAL